MNHNVTLYHRKRARLIALLGGKCARCGATEDLEFDHPAGRCWEPRKVASHTRLNIYAREATQGQVRLLCRSCNGSDGARRRR